MSRRRGTDLRAADWNRGPNRNALGALSYSSVITAPDGRAALTAEVMMALPSTMSSSAGTRPREALVYEALVYMAQQFGFLDATADHFDSDPDRLPSSPVTPRAQRPRPRRAHTRLTCIGR